ncbi:MAG: HU-CCDC81 and SPOR domain-containing protein [Flavobacteriaceae bacterium]|nr:HU-CCDC81 and SPOR domain-containing protein [Flavobacteriaceae bacterium]
MQFERYISDLLYRYECVIISDFGAFLTQNVSAQIHESTNAFYPPKKALSFNEQLQSNDGLLANYIASVEKIPFEAAVSKIAKKVTALKSYLSEGETLTFKNIGDLSQSKEGKIIFEPSYHLNYLTEAFGLSQFVSPSISREVYKKEVEELEKVIPIAIRPKQKKSNNFFKYASIAVLALTLGGFISSNYYLDKIEAHNQQAEAQAQEQLNNKLQEATFVITNPLPSVTLNVTKQSGNYHIVGGAFRFPENCDKMLKELQDLGYPNAYKIGTNKYGLHQVAYGGFETRQEAQRELFKIKRTHNKDAWLLIQELKK